MRLGVVSSAAFITREDNRTPPSEAAVWTAASTILIFVTILLNPARRSLLALGSDLGYALREVATARLSWWQAGGIILGLGTMGVKPGWLILAYLLLTGRLGRTLTSICMLFLLVLPFIWAVGFVARRLQARQTQVPCPYCGWSISATRSSVLVACQRVVDVRYERSDRRSSVFHAMYGAVASRAEADEDEDDEEEAPDGSPRPARPLVRPMAPAAPAPPRGAPRPRQEKPGALRRVGRGAGVRRVRRRLPEIDPREAVIEIEARSVVEPPAPRDAPPPASPPPSAP
eukprot:tig00021432_g21217.t1